MKSQNLSVGDKIFRTANLILMTLLSLSFIFVYVWVLYNSLRLGKSFAAKPFTFSDLELTLKNYVEAFTFESGRNRVTIFGMIGNSLIYTLIIVGLGAIIPPLCGYVFARFVFPGKNFLINTILILMVIPTFGSMSIMYKLVNDINIYDTWFYVFLMNSGGLSFGTLLYRNFFAAIPAAYAESAQLDGAGRLRIYFQIYFPQILPLLLAQSVMTFLGSWNDYMTPYLYMPSYPTVAFGVTSLYNSKVSLGQNYPVIFAAFAFTMTVSFLPYSVFSKTITENVMTGGMKG